ncbi:hypothetical protein JZ751_026379, partial [Albula glossodonta]
YGAALGTGYPNGGGAKATKPGYSAGAGGYPKVGLSNGYGAGLGQSGYPHPGKVIAMGKVATLGQRLAPAMEMVIEMVLVLVHLFQQLLQALALALLSCPMGASKWFRLGWEPMANLLVTVWGSYPMEASPFSPQAWELTPVWEELVNFL